MNINKAISKELKWRCREHPKVTSDFICLDGDAKDRVVCFDCIQNYQIPLSNLIPINYVLEAKEKEILQAFPPLKDQKLSSKLRNTSPQYSLEKIEVYFNELREDIEKEVQAAQQRAKQSLIKQERAYQELIEGYTRIAEVKKLKQLILSDKKSALKDLDDFIKEKWNKGEENRKVMMNLINEYEDEYQFLSNEPNKITQQIINSLQNINFFQQSLQQSPYFLKKSTYNTSLQMEITKVNNSIYQIKKVSDNLSFEQVFIDPIINPLQKYILHIELEQKNGTKQSANDFVFGLTKDEGKDQRIGNCQHMCYNDYSNKYGITKYIKGSPMQSGDNARGKHSFEVRIYLNQKYLRVASLPDYSSIAELDDPNKIDPRIAYRFFLCMAYSGDMMRITNFRTVREFDENM